MSSASSVNIEGKLAVHVAHKINWFLQLQELKLKVPLKKATINVKNVSTFILLPSLKLIHSQCLPQVSWMYS